MKIALAIENFNRHAGGAESYAVELARSLVAEGWEVSLYGHSWDGEPASAVFHEIPRLPKWVPPSIRIMDFALRHRRMVSKESFDVIMGFGNTITMNVYQSHGGVHHLSSVRKLNAVRNPLLRFLKAAFMFASPKFHARAWIEGAAFRTQPRPEIIAIADMVRRDMSRWFGVDEQSIHLVYNGIDASRFGRRDEGKREELRKKFGFGPDDVVFLFMAYDFRKKGVSYLIEAAGELKRRRPQGWSVAVVGREPPDDLLRRLKDLDLEKDVAFPGPTKAPETWYSASDVFILPTFYDACSLVVFEAMAAGLPAITTAFNGASGIITHSVDGAVLKDPADIHEMADAMERFLDKDALSSASQAARLTSSKYTLEANHKAILEILRLAAAKKR